MKILLIIEGKINTRLWWWNWILPLQFVTYQQISIPAIPQVGQLLRIGDRTLTVTSVEFDLAINYTLWDIDADRTLILRSFFNTNENN